MTIHPDRRAELTEMMVQIRRLGTQLLRLNKKYLDREAQVTEWNTEGKANYSGNLSTVLDSDIILRNASGAAKTVSAIITGFTSVLEAELVWVQVKAPARVRSTDTFRPAGGAVLNEPIVTRPQDWAQPARSQIWPEQT